MTQSRTLLLAGLVLLVLGWAFHTYDVKPQHERLDALDARISAAETTTATARQAVEAGLEARASRRTDATRLVRLGKAVPDDLDQPSLVHQVNAAARTAGVDFVAVSLAGDGSPAGATTTTGATPPPGAVAGPDGFAVQPLDLEFRGTYFQLQRFTAALRRLVRVTPGGVDPTGRLIAIDSMTLTPGTAGFPQIDATIKATTYLTLDDDAAPAATTATATPPPTATTTPGTPTTSTAAVR